LRHAIITAARPRPANRIRSYIAVKLRHPPSGTFTNSRGRGGDGEGEMKPTRWEVGGDRAAGGAARGGRAWRGSYDRSPRPTTDEHSRGGGGGGPAANRGEVRGDGDGDGSSCLFRGQMKPPQWEGVGDRVAGGAARGERGGRGGYDRSPKLNEHSRGGGGGGPGHPHRTGVGAATTTR